MKIHRILSANDSVAGVTKRRSLVAVAADRKGETLPVERLLPGVLSGGAVAFLQPLDRAWRCVLATANAWRPRRADGRKTIGANALRSVPKAGGPSRGALLATGVGGPLPFRRRPSLVAASTAVRSLLLLVGSLSLASALALSVGDRAPEAAAADREWVRTVDGWEPLDTLIAAPRSPRLLHPLVVAGMQVFASVGVLVAALPDR